MNSSEDFLNIINNLPKDENGCKIWVRSKDKSGYGYYCFNGRNKKAHRLLFQIKFPGNYFGVVIRHKCDNPSCCNLEHLEKGTQKDNVQDMMKRKRAAVGSKMPTAKLHEEEVREIKKLLKNEHTKIISKKFNVSNSTIAAIKNGRSWKEVEGGSKREDFKIFSRMQRDQKGSKNKFSRLNENMVKEIKERLLKGETVKSIAKDFEVASTTIFSIKQNRTWKQVRVIL